jgi:hypothetical protein
MMFKMSFFPISLHIYGLKTVKKWDQTDSAVFQKMTVLRI